MNHYRQCISHARYWNRRYQTLPRWRFFAKKKALARAYYWGQEARKAWLYRLDK